MSALRKRLATSRYAALAVWLALTTLLCVASFVMTRARTMDELRAKAVRLAKANAAELQGALEKYETLPFVMALHPAVSRALVQPASADAVTALNTYLVDVQQHAGLAAAYVIDTAGVTLAASNWDQPQTFVGNSYRFRPYAQSALAGGVGRFYGIGTTTSEPGYFLAYPVHAPEPGQPLVGAVVIKLALEDFEKTWASSDEPVALLDAHGVVFLSNMPEWKYRSVGPLSAQVRQKIEQTRQYAGRSVSALPAGPRADAGRVHVAQAVGPLGWTLLRYLPEEQAARAGWNALLACLLLATIAALAGYAAQQRLQRRRTAAAARAALVEAAASLEARITTRTQELVQANQELAQRYHELQHAEQWLRRTQTELIQAGKLGMLGQMAAGMTHELNQPLTAVRAFADNAVAFIERGQTGDARDNLTHISDACARMAHIIGQLKGFARKSDGQVGTVDLVQAIHNSALLVRNDFMQRGARLDIHIQRPASVLGDSVRVEQVLINLLRNALDAVDAAGIKQVGVELDADSQGAVVRIADTGPGIAPEVHEHLFEPFFTTKPAGAGLGLGLAISSSIVQAMDGSLSAHNRAEGGAEFVLRLPLHDTGARESAAA